MEERLQNFAAEGDVEGLYSILAEDPFVLENIDKKPFVSTPLHRAVSEGHTHFAKEIVNLKPTFAWKRDHLGRSPIHLALERGHRELVTWLITIDGELVRVKAKGMITPLHYAAEIDDDYSLADFLYVCPSSIKDLTVKCETAVHVALKNGSLRALKVLVGWLRHFDKENILNWVDENGDTALHIATSTNQPEAMKLFIAYVEVNKKNLGGSTALDIFELQQESLHAEVGKVLLHAKAKRASELHLGPTAFASRFRKALITTLTYPFHADPKTTLVEYLTGYFTFRDKILKSLGIGGPSITKLPLEVRNIILVVATLIATAAYQAALSPPGGTWQDYSNLSAKNGTVSNTTSITRNSTGDQVERQIEHHAGEMILGPSLLYFIGCNSLAFHASVCTILIVIVGLRFSGVLYASASLLLFAYHSAVIKTFPSMGDWMNVVGWFLLIISTISAYCIPIFLISKEKNLSQYGQGKLRQGGFE